VELHEQDTIAAGDGLCDRDAVRVLVEEGPALIEQLIEWGTQFDRDRGQLSFTREGAHSRNRILHAHGDSTGREIARALYHKASTLPNVRFQTFLAVNDLLWQGGEVSGAILCDKSGDQVRVTARAVLLATGGLGHVYKETTNPGVATGDGVAMAYLAGADISDIEFIQFHPTALHVEGAPRFLLSEALRGEGAYLRNAAGERFTNELAPRDVVSRAIIAEMARTNSSHVFLDISHRGADFVRRRFPRIYETCLRYGVDIATQPAPVHPAAHYAMGGVRTDLHCRTSVKRLFAAGEVACTGVHGANRLASNSLLEGLVFGARAGRSMRDVSGPVPEASARKFVVPEVGETEVRQKIWDACGISRNAAELSAAVKWFGGVRTREVENPSLEETELRSMHLVGSLIARCALAREESRGGHYRTDFPMRRPEFEKHSLLRLDAEVAFIVDQGTLTRV
jgi:L-aspartate oxidase